MLIHLPSDDLSLPLVSLQWKTIYDLFPVLYHCQDHILIFCLPNTEAVFYDKAIKYLI